MVARATRRWGLRPTLRGRRRHGTQTRVLEGLPGRGGRGGCCRGRLPTGAAGSSAGSSSAACALPASPDSGLCSTRCKVIVRDLSGANSQGERRRGSEGVCIYVPQVMPERRAGEARLYCDWCKLDALQTWLVQYPSPTQKNVWGRLTFFLRHTKYLRRESGR